MKHPKNIDSTICPRAPKLGVVETVNDRIAREIFTELSEPL